MIKIRDSFLKQLILFSMTIVVITILIGYILNFFFLNSFYTERKKSSLLSMRDHIVEIQNNPSILKQYLQELQFSGGVQANILNEKQELQNREGKQILSNLEDVENQTFSIIKVSKIGNTQLVYRENLGENRTLVMRTSLSLISNYRSETDIFNFITTLISLILSGFICYFFSKAFIKDIEILNLSAKKIAELKFPKDIENSREDEIGELSRNIKIMSQNLKDSIENLESFVSDASHELKTPITVMTTCMQSLIKNSNLDEKQRKRNYEIITNEIRELNSLLENLLNLSRIKSLGYKVDKKEMKLKTLIDRSIEKYENLELEKDISVENRLKTEIISGDEKLLKLALDNILQNALKYSPYGGVVKIYNENGFLKISNSTEFAVENTEELWKPFVRDISAKSSKIDGSGLGLSIVKRALDISKKEFGISIENNNFIFFIKI